jgi:X-X-X-Leu-X-X-Gly heptad repeat protein
MNRTTDPTSTDTVPRLARCPYCGALTLSAWSGGVQVAVGVTVLVSGAAQLAEASGHTVYRVRSTRRPTLAHVTDPDEIIADRAYVLSHLCDDPGVRRAYC